jgi:hypothetical protein
MQTMAEPPPGAMLLRLWSRVCRLGSKSPSPSPYSGVEGNQLASEVDSASSIANAFCEDAAIVAKVIGPDKNTFMAWCQPEAGGLARNAPGMD